MSADRQQDRSWPYRSAYALNVLVLAINVGVVVGDLIARRFSTAGYQGLTVVFVAFVTYALHALDDWRVVLMDQARSALACSEKNRELHAEMLASVRRSTMTTITIEGDAGRPH